MDATTITEKQGTEYAFLNESTEVANVEVVHKAKLIPDILKDKEKDEQKGTILLNIEKGIINLAKVLTDSGREKATFRECGIEEIPDEEREHLPNTAVGLFVYYFTKGIKEDFGIEFDETPYSISERKSKTSTRTYEISLKEKKEIENNMNKLKLMKRIASGEITQEEANTLHNEAVEKYEELISKGWIFPEKGNGHIYRKEWVQPDGTVKYPFSGQGRGRKKDSTPSKTP